MKHRHRPAAILFDMDGLLIDSERAALESAHCAASAMSLHFPSHIAQRLIGLSREAGMVVIQEHFGLEVSIEDFYRHWEAEYSLRMDAGLSPKAEVVQTLERLRSLAVPMAVATSTSTPWAEKKLTKAGIHDFFAHIVGRDAVAQGKPAPDLYLEAARRLGVQAGHCWVFEDSLPGLRAAVASGAKAHWVPDIALIDRAQMPAGVERIDSLATVRDWLAHLSA